MTPRSLRILFRIGFPLMLLAGVLAAAGPAMACYGSNEGAYRSDDIFQTKGSRAQLDHFQRFADIGHGIAHPVQIDGFQTADFLGAGTAKGVGVDDCPDYYGTEWQGYADGSVGGIYFCNQPYSSFGGNVDDVRITIQYMSSCNGLSRWGIYIDGDLKLCKTIGATSGMSTAGSESLSLGTEVLQDLTIAIHDLQYRTSTGTWNDWAGGITSCEDPGLDINVFSDTYFSVVMS